jgi:hypothetical protein
MRTDNKKIQAVMEPLITDHQRLCGRDSTYSPKTDEEKVMYQKYKKLESSLHLIPDIIANDAALSVRTFIGERDITDPVGLYFQFRFNSGDVENECDAVRASIEGVFRPQPQPSR